MSAKKKSTASNEVSFEESLSQIQEIVQALEEGTLGLDDSLKQFEVGIGLIRQCHETLEQAEQRIKVLTDVDAEGNPVLTDFDGSSTLEANKKLAGRRKKAKPAEEETDDSDGSSLF